MAWLVKNGIDLDYALALHPYEAQALAVTFSELSSGLTFNWDNGTWPEE